MLSTGGGGRKGTSERKSSMNQRRRLWKENVGTWQESITDSGLFNIKLLGESPLFTWLNFTQVVFVHYLELKYFTAKATKLHEHLKKYRMSKQLVVQRASELRYN